MADEPRPPSQLIVIGASSGTVPVATVAVCCIARLGGLKRVVVGFSLPSVMRAG